MNAKPLSDIVSPVTSAELQDWLLLPTAETKLAGMLSAATEAVITYLHRDLIQRDWVAVFTNLRDFRGGIGGDSFDGYPFLELPFSDLDSVDAVTIDDVLQDITDYEIDTSTTPGRIHFFGRLWAHKITVEYVAGMGENAAAIPDAVKVAIKQTAAYIYEHRGACDAEDALDKSGAKSFLKRLRVERL